MPQRVWSLAARKVGKLSRRGAGDVFTAADERVGLGEVLEFGAEGEGLGEGAAEFIGAARGGLQEAGLVLFSSGGESSDLTFQQRGIDAADSVGFAGTINVGDGGFLKFFNGDGVGFRDLATKEQGQFEAGEEAVGAGEEIAGDSRRFYAVGDGNRVESLSTMGLGDPGGGFEGDAQQFPLEADGLENLGGGHEGQSQAEIQEIGHRGLFGDEGNGCAHLTKLDSGGQKKRAAAGDDDPFALDGPAGFGECLQPADAQDVGKRPAGEREKQLAGAGGEDELLPMDCADLRALGRESFGEKDVGGRGGVDGGVGENPGFGTGEAVEPLAGGAFGARGPICRADVAAGGGHVVEQQGFGTGL